mmetsp:Transcript_48107/g.83807  ORF Transcript_48107/g.83807 Transcript_48107/m.83807 type:complete len:549 (+) Transcript_48107:966-2612(+)
MFGEKRSGRQAQSSRRPAMLRPLLQCGRGEGDAARQRMPSRETWKRRTRLESLAPDADASGVTLVMMRQSPDMASDTDAATVSGAGGAERQKALAQRRSPQPPKTTQPQLRRVKHQLRRQLLHLENAPQPQSPRHQLRQKHQRRSLLQKPIHPRPPPVRLRRRQRKRRRIQTPQSRRRRQRRLPRKRRSGPSQRRGALRQTLKRRMPRMKRRTKARTARRTKRRRMRRKRRTRRKKRRSHLQPRLQRRRRPTQKMPRSRHRHLQMRTRKLHLQARQLQAQARTRRSITSSSYAVCMRVGTPKSSVRLTTLPKNMKGGSARCTGRSARSTMRIQRRRARLTTSPRQLLIQQQMQMERRGARRRGAPDAGDLGAGGERLPPPRPQRSLRAARARQLEDAVRAPQPAASAVPVPAGGHAPQVRLGAGALAADATARSSSSSAALRAATAKRSPRLDPPARARSALLNAQRSSEEKVEASGMPWAIRSRRGRGEIALSSKTATTSPSPGNAAPAPRTMTALEIRRRRKRGSSRRRQPSWRASRLKWRRRTRR